MRKWLGAACLFLASAIPGTATGLGEDGRSGDRPEAPAVLEVWNREIVVFRATLGTLTPARRVEEALVRLRSVPDFALYREVRTEPVAVGDLRGVAFEVDGVFLFAILEEDLDPATGDTLEQVAGRVVARLEDVRDAKRAQRRPSVLARGIGLCLLATAGFVLLLWLLRLTHRAIHRFALRRTARAGKLKLEKVDLRVLVIRVVRRALAVVLSVLAFVAAFAWIQLVLAQFPYTAPWSERLGSRITLFAGNLLDGVVQAIPGVLVVVLIFFVTRGTARVAGRLLESFEAADEDDWFSGDTARATRRLVVVLVWIAGIVIAYPYIPGSDSAAFKGITVLVGLMISLGSTGMVNQVMSGFVVLYTGAVRAGEYAMVGEVEGTVTEIGLLSTRILTPRHEFVTVPNAVLVGKNTINYSRMQDERRTELSTSVTIGYDAPWRQVHAILLEAADRTPGIRETPAPRVLQTALADFYVEYELRFVPSDVRRKNAIRSDLHQRILDAFNEHGVQIMSPHFVDQPAEPVVVPRERWSPAPADPGMAKGDP